MTVPLHEWIFFSFFCLGRGGVEEEEPWRSLSCYVPAEEARGGKENIYFSNTEDSSFLV